MDTDNLSSLILHRIPTVPRFFKILSARLLHISYCSTGAQSPASKRDWPSRRIQG